MNKKIIFYCTRLDHIDFLKDIFEVIVDGSVNEYDFLSDSIKDIYNTFNFELVFEWQVLRVEETNDSLQSVKRVDILFGELIFPDYEEQIEIQEIQKVPEVQVLPEKKTYGSAFSSAPSAWIDPDGNLHVVNFANHETFAADYYFNKDEALYEKLLMNTKGKYFRDYLEDDGWLRILAWTDPPQFSYNLPVSDKIKSTLRQYFRDYKIPYEYYPKY